MILTTGEMYSYALKNPGAKFERMRTGRIYSFGKQGQLILDGNWESHFVPSVNEKWRLVLQHQVTWQEAILAWLRDGKEIVCKLGENESVIKPNLGFFLDQRGMAISNAEFVKGKWFIK
ncbi:hypothetical protein [Desulfosporosinus hippei]|uniref:Uncharacterized protein n=1 Tax=Desulfosporosinus hippei DSM 8344 TaxID=1121419 RepID=A0A1G7UMG9_9FIRM|nr:hypothetical protein [Desulfosporosinus hippei]SDG48677.1 hypothetical protein SAMN05443529_103188 [Desulfosporosinus hippei DSM 8344]